MGLINELGDFMATASLLAIPLALFADTSTGDNAYTVFDAFFAWIFFTVLFVFFR